MRSSASTCRTSKRGTMKVAQQSADVIVRLSMLLLDQYYSDGKGQSIGTSTTDLPESQETPCYLTPLTDFLLVPIGAPRCYGPAQDIRIIGTPGTQRGSALSMGPRSPSAFTRGRLRAPWAETHALQRSVPHPVCFLPPMLLPPAPPPPTTET